MYEQHFSANIDFSLNETSSPSSCLLLFLSAITAPVSLSHSAQQPDLTDSSFSDDVWYSDWRLSCESDRTTTEVDPRTASPGYLGRFATLSLSRETPKKDNSLLSQPLQQPTYLVRSLYETLSLRQLSPQLGVGEPCSEQPTKKDILQNCSATCACCSLCRTAHDRSRR